MEITLDQALQQAVAAHREGNVQEAERLYLAILQAQPDHPDANNNLGILTIGLGKTEAALPLFKKALEANPDIGQFWLNYVDCLIKLERLVDADIALADAKHAGVATEELTSLEEEQKWLVTQALTPDHIIIYGDKSMKITIVHTNIK